MKFQLVIEAEVLFDLECDGETSTERESIDSDIVGQAINRTITSMLCNDADEIVDAVTDATGWCSTSMRIRVIDAECTDYLD
jgi:hypothetical protein